MIPMMVDYAMPSVFESTRERDALGFAANARRPVRFHGKAIRNVPMLRFALRALGEAIWSSDLWMAEGEYMAWTLDPVITIHPDRIFLEAFSQDQSVYAALILNPGMFQTDGEVRTGTTNVDFSAWLWAALGEMRSSRETWFRVEAGGFEVKTKGAGGRFEQKVELPESWVRGFLQFECTKVRRLGISDPCHGVSPWSGNVSHTSPRFPTYETLGIPESRASIVIRRRTFVLSSIRGGEAWG